MTANGCTRTGAPSSSVVTRSQSAARISAGSGPCSYQSLASNSSSSIPSTKVHFGSAGHDVRRAVAREQQIIASAPVEAVASRPAIQLVAPARTDQHVCARPAGEVASPAARTELVVAASANGSLELENLSPSGPIGRRRSMVRSSRLFL